MDDEQLPISAGELLLRIADEVSLFSDEDLATWSVVKVVVPTSVEHRPATTLAYATHSFVVARAGMETIYFDDEEDEFGRARLEDGALKDRGLIGDLADCVRHLRNSLP